MLLLRSPLGERQRSQSASLQRLSSARRKPFAVLGAASAAAEAQSQQHLSASTHHAAGLATAEPEMPARHNPTSALSAHVQRTENCTQIPACRRAAAEAAAAEEDFAPLSPSSLPSSAGTPIKARAPPDRGPARRAAAPDCAAAAARSALHEAVVRSPFQSAQPSAAGTGSGAFARQGATAAPGSRRPDIAQSARHPPLKPQSTGAVNSPTRPRT